MGGISPPASASRVYHCLVRKTSPGRNQPRGADCRALGGGIRDIHWHSILVNGNDASVTVDATLWSRLKYNDEFGKTHIAAPASSLTKDYTLRRINGQWLVSSVVDDTLQEG